MYNETSEKSIKLKTSFQNKIYEEKIMKKKIILALVLVSVFVCLFAISASAATEVDGIWYNLTVTDAEAKIGTAEVTADNATQCTLTDVKIPSYVEKDGITYTVTTIAYHAFSGAQGSWGKNQTIKTLYIPDTVTSIGAHFLRQCASVESVVIKAKNPNGIVLSNAEFYQCTSLTSVDMSESDITSFVQYTFYGCENLTDIKYPPKLKSIGEKSMQGCKKLAVGDFTNTQLETIGKWAMGDCYAMKSLKLPTTFKGIISSNALQNMPLTELVFPHGLETLAKHSLPVMGSLYMLVIPEIPEDNTTLNAEALVSTNPKVVIYSGTKYEHLTADGKIFASYDVILPFSEYDPDVTYTQKTFFYGATTCSICNGLLGEKKFNFTSFTEEMSYGAICTHCGDTDAIRSYDAMFECLGYSAPVDGSDGFTIKYRVNSDAVAGYTYETGKEVSYGLFVVTKLALGENDILDADGTPANGVIKADVTNTNYAILSLKMVGFQDEQSRTLDFAVGTYVITEKEEVKEFAYIQAGDVSEGEKYNFTTYEKIISTLPNE